MAYDYGVMVGMILTGETKVLGEKPVPMSYVQPKSYTDWPGI